MTNEISYTPRLFKGVMVSSTFTDLFEHRTALIKAIKGQGLTDIAMENDSAKPDVDVIESSFQMVRDSSAYISVISRKYGQTPEDLRRNPNKLSLTELEFNEAQRLGRPILLFIMGDTHPVTEADIEFDSDRRVKLATFRERAKQMRSDSTVHRVYSTFNSLDEFKVLANQAMGNLRRYLDETNIHDSVPIPNEGNMEKPATNPIPLPPALYAEPPYIGSHRFVGRNAQLEVLSDWAEPSDSHPVLLFEAIGGTGKSMLTWEWTINHSTLVRQDWAGRFWYSFYEKGAVMAAFCRHTLAYMTGRPLEELQKKKTTELSGQLLFELRAKPWLLILDGMERVLVAYHRYDAAQVSDDQVDVSVDLMAKRNPTFCIRPEDDDLLRLLAAATPSKLLISTRLTPRVLLNPSGQAIQGVQRILLPGLRPLDAEDLFRACGIKGNGQDIQNYLKSHCDCHPLVTGILAGLINDYLPDRGNFDAWVADATGGGNLNLADLDLVQKRNHILNAAFDALPEEGRQLLATLSLLSGAVNYNTLKALNPHLPPEPTAVKEPIKPNERSDWQFMNDDEKTRFEEEYVITSEQWQKYQQTLVEWTQSPQYQHAIQALQVNVRDLERRGLLQYDHQTQRYDLHPVVRGVASGKLQQKEKEQYGRRVVDHFLRQTHNPFNDAQSLDELGDGLYVAKTLLKMGHLKEAREACNKLFGALLFNLEAYDEALSLIRPFFTQGWTSVTGALEGKDVSNTIGVAALTLHKTGNVGEAITLYNVAILALAHERDEVILAILGILFNAFMDIKNYAKAARCQQFCNAIAPFDQDEEGAIAMIRLNQFRQLSTQGLWTEAEAKWQHIEARLGDDSSLEKYGDEVNVYGWFPFYQACFTEEQLNKVKQWTGTKNRFVIRNLYALRGQWQTDRGEWDLAVVSLHEAVRMAREIGQLDAGAETLLALSKFHLSKLSDPGQELERLENVREPHHLGLALLWLAIGDNQNAKKHALAAYKEAWADGEPYVFRRELDKSKALLEQLGVAIPMLPPYDPSKDEKLPWEDEVTAYIEKLRAKTNE